MQASPRRWPGCSRPRSGSQGLGARVHEQFAAALDDPLVTAVIERAQKLGSSPDEEVEVRNWYGAAEGALRVNPAHVLFSSFISMGMLRVTDDAAEEPLLEAVVMQERLTPEVLEPYRVFLAARGEAEAAARVERAQGVLGLSRE